MSMLLLLSKNQEPATASKMLHRLAQACHAATADFQRFLAMAQHRLYAAIVDAPQFDQFVPRHQAIAMDAHEARTQFVFQRLQ